MSNRLIGAGFLVVGAAMAWAGYRIIRRYDPGHPKGSVTFTAPMGAAHRMAFACGYLLLIVGLVLAVVMGGIFLFV